MEALSSPWHMCTAHLTTGGCRRRYFRSRFIINIYISALFMSEMLTPFGWRWKTSLYDDSPWNILYARFWWIWYAHRVFYDNNIIHLPRVKVWKKCCVVHKAVHQKLYRDWMRVGADPDLQLYIGGKLYRPNGRLGAESKGKVPGQRVRGRSQSEAVDALLFQRLIS